jgi:general secretion pathway protein G
MKRKRTHRRPGFTLLEVLLVLVILAVLASTATIYIRGARNKALYNAAKAQISEFENALEMYELDNQTYPSAGEGLQALRNPPNGLDPYLRKEIPLDPWGSSYQYVVEGNQYRIWSYGQDRADGTADDVSN